MAYLLHTICFRASTGMRDRLMEIAARDNRKLGDAVRILLERMLKMEEKEIDGSL